jgi:V/A-type H+-transporting ATPase subunit I
MVRAFVGCRRRDRDRLLERLRGLGVLHLIPATEEALDDPEVREALRHVDAALRILRGVTPAGPRPDGRPLDAAREAVALHRSREERLLRLELLRRELGRLALWGGVRPEQLEDLNDAGVELEALSVPTRAVRRLRGELVRVLYPLPHRRSLVVAVNLDPTTVSARAEFLAQPERSREEITREAEEVEAEIKAMDARLAELAHLASALQRERARIEGVESWRAAVRGAVGDDEIFAVQGWLPAEDAPTLSAELAASDLRTAVALREPEPDQQPPTLIRYRWWTRPIEGLFRILSMVPGYDEPEASGTFVVALPLFAGMIIGDAGYGLLFVVAALLAGGRLGRALGADTRILLGLFGLAALLWGAVTGVWFGLTPDEIATGGGLAAPLGEGLGTLRLIGGEENAARLLVIKVCFVIGCAHLLLAHAGRVAALAPDPRALSEVGWCLVLLAMLGVIWILFFGRDAGDPTLLRASMAGLVAGWALVILYTQPARPLGARLGLGFAGSLIPLLGTFGDTLSYIRLMAVGLASYYLGATFNILASDLAEVGTWAAGGAVLVAGHLLNIGLILIAIFAHGVRLNVLEFSTNAGIHWTGYPYEPFTEAAGEVRT